ncbi:dihydrofolate reductase family protein [Petropleomorpha daqingensis]|uniref:Dihydrofolate reductase n=1 Tax=Petropleomorpha daqingensis TaxID=2026353 RepID=A0A853CCF0_9ACTN|nr:dihydrofolate reductase family protein [Petropleomorpha daqingensis]NYJ05570.1 dihydrofolate reductase [Petropleomorpha daqingensis]
MPRPLVVQTFVTLDGVMQAPGGPEEDASGGFAYGGWSHPFFSDDSGQQVVDWFAGAQDFLLGRTTYEIFAGFWPQVPADAGNPIADALNTKPKHVASRTLDKVDWDGARLIEGDVAEAVRALTAEDGGELQVHGSAGLIQTLLAEDLVDELRVMVSPVTLGSGKRLFGDGTIPRSWRVTSSRATSTGVLITTYQRVGELKTGEFTLDEELHR